MREAKVRLYLDQPLGPGQAVQPGPDQAHYLFSVMRLSAGQEVRLFNGRDGEWSARVAEAGRKTGTLVCTDRTAAQLPPADLWLLFAPLKKARTDFLVEKAVEMGAARLQPVQTRFTNAERIRPEKMRAHVIEAAEQCGATQLPEVADLVSLDRLLSAWPADRHLMWADEGLAGRPRALPDLPRGKPWALLIGPEGGFSDAERDRLHALPQAVPVSLGPRILRAETAAVAAMTLWQMQYGDWS